MTDEWQSLTHRSAIRGRKRYVTVATDEHGRPVLLEIRMAKAGGVQLSAYVERISLRTRARDGGGNQRRRNMRQACSTPVLQL